jgi:hypothetical protein
VYYKNKEITKKVGQTEIFTLDVAITAGLLFKTGVPPCYLIV